MSRKIDLAELLTAGSNSNHRFNSILNPIKAGGSESMYSLEGVWRTLPPLEKGLRGLKCMFIAQFCMASSKKKT